MASPKPVESSGSAETPARGSFELPFVGREREIPQLGALHAQRKHVLIITAHGMIELRGALVMLLERLENHAFEIGIFGRVSSGKSSLLNHLLGSEILPVGVTPVTAFPTRVSYGIRPQAIIEFAEDKPQTVELSRLTEFATEQQNPGNTKHVMRIRVQVPARRLREGVTFVDTPGLGSLATAGAEETVAYLPRCDLGIVLVDGCLSAARKKPRLASRALPSLTHCSWN